MAKYKILGVCINIRRHYKTTPANTHSEGVPLFFILPPHTHSPQWQAFFFKGKKKLAPLLTLSSCTRATQQQQQTHIATLSTYNDSRTTLYSVWKKDSLY